MRALSGGRWAVASPRAGSSRVAAWGVAASGALFAMPVWAADDALGGVAGFGALLARTLFVLAAVAALAVLTLRWAAARGIGRAEPGARLVVLARQPIGARQQLLAVQMADRVMLVGASPGRLDRLGEVSASSWAAEEAPATDGASFAALLEGGTP